MSEKKKNLVVDDKKGVFVYQTTLLEDNGYKTISAEDGRKGFDRI